jgi:hypothetical protein
MANVLRSGIEFGKYMIITATQTVTRAVRGKREKERRKKGKRKWKRG